MNHKISRIQDDNSRKARQTNSINKTKARSNKYGGNFNIF